MPSLFSSKQIIRTLEAHGFRKVSQKGSHVKFRCDQYTVIVPHPRKEIPMGTFISIVRQSGLNKNDF